MAAWHGRGGLAVAALLICITFSAAWAQAGGEYDLSWSTIDGGGGTSTDGDYSVSGTVGQIDAGTASDEEFTLVGGFWGGASAPPSGACVGDCGADGVVTVDELIVGVNIALGDQMLDRCPPFDANNDGLVTIDELIQAVNNVLNGCR